MHVEIGAGASAPAPVSLKGCATCQERLPLHYFNKNSANKDGLQKSCRQCHSAQVKAYRTPDKIKHGNLKQRYGMTLDDYYDLLKAQSGVCASCGSPPAGKYLEVDHDHSCCSGETSCGKCVRALLCKGCNVALKAIGDDLGKLRALAVYLEARNGQKLLHELP